MPDEEDHLVADFELLVTPGNGRLPTAENGRHDEALRNLDVLEPSARGGALLDHAALEDVDQQPDSAA